MKLRLPFILLSLCCAAEAAVLHNDVSLLTYTDFGQNCGRYSTSEVNALLTELNKDGVAISYTGGQTSYTLPQPMIDFSSVVDKGNSTALSYGFVASVRHLQGSDEYARVQSPTFGLRHVGTEHTIQYQGIEYGNSDQFCLSPEADYKLIRLSKIATDTTPAALFNFTSNSIAQLYSAGAGDCYKANSTGQASHVHWWSQSIDGSIMMATWLGKVNEDTYGKEDARGCTDDSIRIQSIVDSWSNDGITSSDPLPSLKYEGDSGSPIFIWDAEEKRYEFIGATNANDATKGLNQYMVAPVWTAETMASFNKTASLSTTDHQLSLVRTDTAGSPVTDSSNRSATSSYAGLFDSAEKQLTEFAVLEEGQSTWKSLSDLRNSGNWYNYGASYLNATKNATEGKLDYTDLFLTENLVVQAADTNIYTITVKDKIDTGIGYLHFTRGSGVSQGQFILQAAEGASLHTAGLVINSGVTVMSTITNTDANAMCEWRKTGFGGLIIAGEGNNEIFLNLGGQGATLLAQSNGYAAHSVIANTGSRVILNGIEQIAERFTSGTGGSVLDFNGCHWTEGTHFDIHALTQDAILANRKGASRSTLHFNQGGTFLASFQDAKSSSLTVIYEGSEKWILNSIHTNLQHASSGLVIASGHVALAGNLTEHAMGSLSGQDNVTNRYTHEDDWHYADATMNVTVESGGIFELDSHARLTGTVTVMDGGTYIMREGVRHAQEYIEGGYTLENTADISAFYGHHGDTVLEAGSTLLIAYNEGVTVTNSYSGTITGSGTIMVDLGASGLTFNLAGPLGLFTGEIIVKSGSLQLSNSWGTGIKGIDEASASKLKNIKATRTGLRGTAHDSSLSKAILEIQECPQFSITDMMLNNVSISSAADSLILKNVQATDVELAKGNFTIHADTLYSGHDGNNVSFITDSLSGITLNRTDDAASLTLDLGYLMPLLQMAPGIYNLSITLSGFFLDDYSSGLYFAADSLLGQWLLAQEIMPYTSDTGALLLSLAGNANSASLTFEAIENQGTLVTIKGLYIPEPATVSLSLLALAGLAARRRR